MIGHTTADSQEHAEAIGSCGFRLSTELATD